MKEKHIKHAPTRNDMCDRHSRAHIISMHIDIEEKK